MFKKVWSLVLVLALAMVALPAAAEPAFAPIAAGDIKVGAVFIGPKDDGFSGAHYNGIEGMKVAQADQEHGDFQIGEVGGR